MAIVAAAVCAIGGVYAVAVAASTVIAVAGGVVAGAVSAAPALLCIGGIALVAAHQGY